MVSCPSQQAGATCSCHSCLYFLVCTLNHTELIHVLKVFQKNMNLFICKGYVTVEKLKIQENPGDVMEDVT